MTAAKMPLRYGSLCTGIGGLDLAVEAHFGATAAWLSEIEPGPCAVIERHWPGVPNLGDLKLIDWLATDPVDVLTAGYPCQPFSHAGKRKGADDPRHLWPFIIEAVRTLRPRWVVLENVRGHLSLGFDAVLGDLAEAGFDAEWCVLRASDVGAPHQRARVFIVATDTRGAGAGGDTRGVPRSTETGGRSDLHVRAVGDAGEAPANPHGLNVDRGGHLGSGRRAEPTDGRQDAPDANRGRLTEQPQRHGQPDTRREPSRGNDPERLGDAPWGAYARAIRRWEHALGRPAPTPTDEQGRLAPPFVEWMLGYSEGWTAELGRTAALKALGNAVVTQQALAALCELAPITTLAEAVA